MQLFYGNDNLWLLLIAFRMSLTCHIKITSNYLVGKYLFIVVLILIEIVEWLQNDNSLILFTIIVDHLWNYRLIAYLLLIKSF